MFHQWCLQNVLIIKLVVLKSKQRPIHGACGRGREGGLTHPLFCQIIIKSAPDWLDYIQTKISEGGVNHPRHPHIMDSLLHLNTQYDIFKNSCYLPFFLIWQMFFVILQKSSKSYHKMLWLTRINIFFIEFALKNISPFNSVWMCIIVLSIESMITDTSYYICFQIWHNYPEIIMSWHQCLYVAMIRW